jgi:hypothetical protein
VIVNQVNLTTIQIDGKVADLANAKGFEIGY